MQDLNLNAAQLSAYKESVTEVVAAMMIIKQQQELIKEVCAHWKDEHEIKPKTTKAVAKIVYEDSLEAEKTEKQSLFELVESLPA